MNLLKLNKFCLKYETFQERRLLVARQVTMAGLSKRNLTHNRTCIKDICTGTTIFVTSVKLLHPLPFENSRSHKNCDFESETFGLPIHLWP